MSTFSLKSDGNIDVTRLEKDLRSALDFNTKYKQADNMKKRACKIATDYDEFKAFVACAHLKTVRYRTNYLYYRIIKIDHLCRPCLRDSTIFLPHSNVVVRILQASVLPKKVG